MMNQLLCAVHVLTVLAAGPGFMEEEPDRDGGNHPWEPVMAQCSSCGGVSQFSVLTVE